MIDTEIKYPISEGDTVICLSYAFNGFTYGGLYTLRNDVISTVEHIVLPMSSDSGLLQLPVYYEKLNDEVRRYHFFPINIWRELRLDDILND